MGRAAGERYQFTPRGDELVVDFLPIRGVDGQN